MASDYDASAARGKAFQSFYDRTGRKSFSPEFITSIVQTLQIAEGVCLTERVWAWVRWRTWGNSSETAMSSWHSSGWELDQVDCALDLYWFEKGKSLDDVANATREDRAAARRLPEVARRKTRISRSFTELKARAQVDCSRGRIYALVAPVDSPQVLDNRLLVADASNYALSNPEFVNWLTRDGSSNQYSDYIEARTSYHEARKGIRASYREWRKQQLSGDVSLLGLKVDKEVKEYSGGGVVRSAVESPPPPPSPPITPEQETGVVVQGYLCRMKPGESVEWPDTRILLAIHEVRLKAQKTVQDLVALLDDLWRRGRKPKGYAWIRTVMAEEWGVEDA